MRTPVSILALACLSSLAPAQTVTSVYNRDTHEPFRLRAVQVDSTVIGPIVRTSAWLTYDNPYKTLTEATLNFELPNAAALSGFAYRYGDEYVHGQLMDKAKAWFIYTAITSRNRDPGIMEQWSPTTYHCQIFPLKKGQPLRVRLWTVGMVGPNGALPKPQVPNAVSAYRTDDASLAAPRWNVRSVRSGPVRKEGGDFFVDATAPVSAVAQRFKDGRVYVAGTIRPTVVGRPKIEIASARYGPQGAEGGADVTQKVAAMVAQGRTTIPADNAQFGDPYPDVFKWLRIAYRIDGQPHEVQINEHDRLDLAQDAPSAPIPTFKGLKQTKTIRLDDGAYAFCGWAPKNRTLTTTVGGKAMAFRPRPIPAGADAARLWAQQRLATDRWTRSKDVLAFSLKYGVPSNATALLAVPQEEMARYRQKAKEYQKLQAEQRRQELERARQARAWAKTHPQNWRASGGGDPELRVTIPNALRVEAILPDRRVIELRADGDVWGGNFEIPATAAEGTYRVRIVAHLRDGTTIERSWTYEVDRTAPKGFARFAKGTLTVESEPGLAEVAAYTPSGARIVLAEILPGVYQGAAPKDATVVLKDKAGNKGEAAWSSRS